MVHVGAWCWKYITVRECEGQFEITEQSDEYKKLVSSCFSRHNGEVHIKISYEV